MTENAFKIVIKQVLKVFRELVSFCLAIMTTRPLRSLHTKLTFIYSVDSALHL